MTNKNRLDTLNKSINLIKIIQYSYCIEAVIVRVLGQCERWLNIIPKSISCFML